MNSGVYEILNTLNGYRYVGSAVNFVNRWNEHRRHLKNGSHHSPYLQKSWKKHGSRAFEFRKLIECDREHLLMYEQSAIDGLRPEYNSCPVAGSSAGFKHSKDTLLKMSQVRRGHHWSLGIKHTDAAKANMRASKAKFKGIKREPFTAEHRARIAASKVGNNNCLGRKLSAETRAKIAAGNKGRTRSRETRAKREVFTASQVLEIRKRITAGETQLSIATCLGVAQSTISRVLSGRRYAWVEL